jgi:hypothetical protein
MPSRKRRSSQLATEFGLAGMHTFMTLWYRLPMFAAPNGKSHPEFGRMVSEKTAAMVEGAWDAQAEALRIAGAAATGRLAFSDLAGAPAHIAAAGLRPAFRTVKANSKRLHRRGTR